MPIDIANVIVSFAVGTVGAGIVGAVINRRFTAALEVWRSRRGWEESSVAELLGPVFIQLDRTKRAFDRWDGKNLFLEAQVVRAGNLAIRDLLLSKPHLIPPELRDAASTLILHYDVWLEEFDRVRATQTLGESQHDFVFAGPKGYSFPVQADEKFRNAFHETWNKLYAKKA
jgi:hypothetical protein